MTILALLVSLLIERVSFKRPTWEGKYYAQLYYAKLFDKKWLDANSAALIWLLAALIPALIVALLIRWLPGYLMAFLLQTFVLFICIGSQALRDMYKCFLQAANRGDVEACYLYSQQMGHCDTKPDKCASFGLQLVWLNYQHYAAIITAFVVFGAPGAVFYVLVREALEFAHQEEQLSTNKVTMVRHWVDWIPVRISAFGMLLVGNFSHGFSVWMATLFDLNASASSVLTKVSAASEVLPTNDEGQTDITEEPTILVKLAKRNMMFMLVIVSLLTVSGVL